MLNNYTGIVALSTTKNKPNNIKLYIIKCNLLF